MKPPQGGIPGEDDSPRRFELSLALEMDWEGRIWSLGLRREEELVERVRRSEKTE